MRAMFTLALSVTSGWKTAAVRAKSERQGSVANSEYAMRPVRSASLRARPSRNRLA